MVVLQHIGRECGEGGKHLVSRNRKFGGRKAESIIEVGAAPAGMRELAGLAPKVGPFAFLAGGTAPASKNLPAQNSDS
jgi:hypothetical protein